MNNSTKDVLAVAVVGVGHLGTLHAKMLENLTLIFSRYFSKRMVQVFSATRY